MWGSWNNGRLGRGGNMQPDVKKWFSSWEWMTFSCSSKLRLATMLTVHNLLPKKQTRVWNLSSDKKQGTATDLLNQFLMNKTDGQFTQTDKWLPEDKEAGDMWCRCPFMVLLVCAAMLPDLYQPMKLACVHTCFRHRFHNGIPIASINDIWKGTPSLPHCWIINALNL